MISAARALSLLGILSITCACGSAGRADSAESRALGDSDIGAFYRVEENLTQPAGTLMRVEPLRPHQALENAAQSTRLLYTSTEGLFGEEIVAVSGALYLPKGKVPKGGWPLIVWHHGTVGIADVCAPSWFGRQQRDTIYLNYWLSQGYAIAASDYQGLGTRGTHPYLAVRPAAYSSLDMVRAVQTGDFPVSKSVVLLGQSQGAAAAFATAGFAVDYAPEVKVEGVVVTGIPYFSAEGLAAISETRPKDKVDPLLAYNLMAITMLAMVDPQFEMRAYLTDAAMRIIAAADDTCYRQLRSVITDAELTYNTAFKQSPVKVLEKAFKEMEYPSFKLTVPVFLGAGQQDRHTPIKMQQALLTRACQAGTPMQGHLYANGNHRTVVNGSAPQSTTFVQSLFAGQAVESTCKLDSGWIRKTLSAEAAKE